MNLRETHQIGRLTRERLVGPQAVPALAGCGVRLCGTSLAKPPFAFVRQRPDMAQALCCLAGAGRVLVSGRWRRMGAGQAYISPPGALHAYHALPGAGWRLCWVHVHAATVPGMPAQPMLRRADATGLAAALDGLLAEVGGAGDAALLRSWAELVGAQARRLLGHDGRSDVHVHELWQQVDGDLGKPWTVTGLARLAGIGPEQLRRRCRRAYGRSPLAHLAWLRARRAAALLANSTLSIGAVAQAVGYANAFAFSTAFRRVLGKPPSRVRARP